MNWSPTETRKRGFSCGVAFFVGAVFINYTAKTRTGIIRL